MALDTMQRLQLLLEHQKTIRRFIQNLVHDEEVAADLSQEVGMTVFLHPIGPTDESAFCAWCLGVARNTVSHYRRSELRRSYGLLKLAEELYDRGSRVSEFDPELRCELREAVATCMGALEQPARELVMRRYVFGETASEVAESLQQSPAAVRMRLMRFRALMRDARAVRPCSDSRTNGSHLTERTSSERMVAARALCKGG